MTGFASIEFAPYLSWPALAALTAVVVLLLGYCLARRLAGAGWRALAFAAALAALANPALVTEDREPLDDVAVIVVDRSASQAIGERGAQTDAALARIGERLARFAGLEVRQVIAGPGAGESAEQAAVNLDTRLFAALDRALVDTPGGRVAGAILITDGQVHDVPADAQAAALGAPVHGLLTGTPGEQDRRLVIEAAPKYGLVGGRLELTVRVIDLGRERGSNERRKPVLLTLVQDGGGAVRHLVPVGESRAIPFTLSHGGVTVLELEAAPGRHELTLQNNRAVVVVNGVRDRLRVLLVSGEPYPGERTWRNLLKADPSVDLVHFTILRPPEKQDGTPVKELSLIAFPTRQLFEVKLHEFDLIIFDRYRRRGVLPRIYLENVANYVQQGGAVLEAAGPSFATPLSLFRTPLGQVLPGEPSGRVIEQGFRPLLTADGRRHPVTAELPGAAEESPTWGRWFRLIDVEPTRGSVLMTGVGARPILILDRVGEGRVAQLLSDHGWLWARGFEGGGPQAELLRRIAHWLMKEPDLEENDLRMVAEGSRLEVRRRRLEPDQGRVTVTAPSGASVELKLEEEGGGRASATLQAREMGLYQASDGSRRAVAAVGALNPYEFRDVRATAERLEPVTAATGGGLFWLAEDGLPDIRRTRPGRNSSGRGWIGLRANGQYRVTGIEQTALLPPWLVLLLMLGGLMLAWRREGA